MAAPVDAARATYNGSTSSTSHSVTLPASSAGDILLVLVRTPPARTITFPDGWEQLFQGSPDADDGVSAVFIKVADGTEGTTVSVSLNAAAFLAGASWQITGGTNGSMSSVAIFTTGQPDSPSYTIAATRDVLWLSLGSGQNVLTLTSGPSGYANAQLQAHTGGGASDGTSVTVFGASKQATSVTTENPGAWTLGGTLAASSAWTVAIYSGAMPARVSQHPVETVLSPTSGKARVSQIPVEAAVLPTSQQARVSQMAVEVIIENVAAQPSFQAIIFN